MSEFSTRPRRRLAGPDNRASVTRRQDGRFHNRMLTPLLRATTLALLLTLAACGSAGGGGRQPSPPPGMTAVAHGGVRVLVPSGWARNTLRCGVPYRDSVVVDPGPVEECLISPPPRVNYAWLRSSDNLATDPEAAVATRPRSALAGHAARVGEDTLADGRTRVVLVVPDLHQVVVAVAIDPTVARSIVESASTS